MQAGLLVLALFLLVPAPEAAVFLLMVYSSAWNAPPAPFPEPAFIHLLCTDHQTATVSSLRKGYLTVMMPHLRAAIEG